MEWYYRNNTSISKVRKKFNFKRYIARRFFIRFHMSLILMGTILSGLIFSKLLLLINLEEMVIRYPLVVVLSYGCFFILIRIWLSYIRDCFKGKDDANSFDAMGDFTSCFDGSPGKAASQALDCGGGEFGGGGVSGSFLDAEGSVSFESSSSGLGDAAGEAGESLLEEGGIILIPLMLLLSAIFGTGIFLIYQAPVILSEAAFEFVLASALLRRAKVINKPDWVGSVLENTWKQFLFTLLFVFVVAALLNYNFPDAIKISQIFK